MKSNLLINNGISPMVSVRKKRGRPALGLFEKRTIRYYIKLNISEEAIASDLMEFHRLKNMSELFIYMQKNEAVKRRNDIKANRRNLLIKSEGDPEE
ncbi:MAG: hypothetical protein IPM69_11820 [Ignavibacteria bacterium]|nr:hypothetical protein [Ignavibacteria bacterium]